MMDGPWPAACERCRKVGEHSSYEFLAGCIIATLAYMHEADTTHELRDFLEFSHNSDPTLGESWRDSVPELALAIAIATIKAGDGLLSHRLVYVPPGSPLPLRCVNAGFARTPRVPTGRPRTRPRRVAAKIFAAREVA